MGRLRSPRQAPPRVRPDRTPGPNARERRRIQRLNVERDEVAAELGIPSGLLCPRATVMSVAASSSSADGLAEAGHTGWRAELLARRFASVLAEET